MLIPSGVSDPFDINTYEFYGKTIHVHLKYDREKLTQDKTKQLTIQRKCNRFNQANSFFECSLVWSLFDFLRLNSNNKNINNNSNIKGIYQSSWSSHQRTVHAVHLVIQSTSVAQIVPSSISTPQWCRNRTTIHTFTSFRKYISL